MSDSKLQVIGSGVSIPLESAILEAGAVTFLTALSERFEPTRMHLLLQRAARLTELKQGKLYDFLPETADVRNSDWTVAPIPHDLLDRRVEITGPVDRKMIINALNSGAKVFMADLEDSSSPTWQNVIEGQANLRDAVLRKIELVTPEGKAYRLQEKTAVMFVRPRGWHLVEKHVNFEGRPMSGSLFDFGLYFFHNARALMDRGTAPYLYLPKLESHKEARLWNEVFNFSQDYLSIPRGTIRATVLIETLPAAFEMDEILFELKEHSAGLNCGRWDYIFSFIKKFSHLGSKVLPDRSQVTMDKHFLKSYVDLLIHTCHRREVHAMGGMAAQIPIKSDAEANERALARVRQDKLREVLAGHDGTWVAHPGLIPVAKEVFDINMPGPNQISKKTTVEVSAADLMQPTVGDITQAGLDMNIDVGIQYLEAWLRGNGCVPIFNLMEDAATAEISRAQLWQWSHHHARMQDGSEVTVEKVLEAIPPVLIKIRLRVGEMRYEEGAFEQAAEMFSEMTQRDEFPEFLTIVAYEKIN